MPDLNASVLISNWLELGEVNLNYLFNSPMYYLLTAVVPSLGIFNLNVRTDLVIMKG